MTHTRRLNQDAEGVACISASAGSFVNECRVLLPLHRGMDSEWLRNPTGIDRELAHFYAGPGRRPVYR